MSKNDEGGLFRELVMGLVLPLVKLCRTYEYTVKQVYADGRMDLAPTKSKIAPKLAGVPQWGPSGTRATPRIGSTVAVSFLDGDPGKPVVTSFTPLGTQVGRPRKIEIDTDPDGAGDGIILAQGTRAVSRVNDTVNAGALSASSGVTLTVTYTPPGAAPMSITIGGVANLSTGVVTFTAAGSATLAGVITSGNSEVKA